MMQESPITIENIAEKATTLYNKSIKQQVETEENIGKMVIIDPETGDFRVGENGIAPSRSLHALRPDARLFGIRIGYRVAGAIGGTMERTV